MPLPFLFWAVAATATAFWGTKKVMDGNEMYEEAKRIRNNARRRYDSKRNEFDNVVSSIKRKARELTDLKRDIYSTTVRDFIRIIKKFEDVKMKGKISKLKFKLTSEELKDFEREALVFEDAAKSLLSGSAAGAAAGFGTLGLVGTLGTASTGTAIGTLSGAAATNATLAWLGGGSLAAGGLGVAGGMVALGGIFLSPAILIGGWVYSSQAEEDLKKAEEVSLKVEKEIEKLDLAMQGLRAVQKRIQEVGDVISGINMRIRPLLNELVKIDRRLGKEQYQVQDLTESELKLLQMVFLLARGLKEALGAPILSKDGVASTASAKAVSDALKIIQEVENA